MENIAERFFEILVNIMDELVKNVHGIESKQSIHFVQ